MYQPLKSRECASCCLGVRLTVGGMMEVAPNRWAYVTDTQGPGQSEPCLTNAKPMGLSTL